MQQVISGKLFVRWEEVLGPDSLKEPASKIHKAQFRKVNVFR